MMYDNRESCRNVTDESELNPKRLTPKQLATLAALMYAGQEMPSPETALSEALELYCETLTILRNEFVHAPESIKPWDRKAILDRLIRYMETSGKGATEIGRELGLNRATITLWRAGKGGPSRKTSAKIAKFLDANVLKANPPG
jgi:DNA-binding XRE family transcriptional regulator